MLIREPQKALLAAELLTHRRSVFLQTQGINLGMLMSVSLGVLAFQLFPTPFVMPPTDCLIRATGNLISAVWVITEYFTFAQAQDRHLLWLDIVPQYFLGVTEIGACALVQEKSLWTALSIAMAGGGVIAYLVQLPDLRRDTIHPDLTHLLKWNAICGCILTGILEVVIFSYGYFSSFPSWLLLSAYLFVVGMLFGRGYLLTKKLKALEWPWGKSKIWGPARDSARSNRHRMAIHKKISRSV